MRPNLSPRLWETLKPAMVAPISDEQIAAMRHILPLILEPGTGWFRRIKGADKIDPRNSSFLWDAEMEGERMAFGPLARVRIMTFHTWGFYGFFKPSLAEVYSAILRFCGGFEGVRYFSLHAENFGTDHIIGDFHWCVCDLFGEPFCE